MQTISKSNIEELDKVVYIDNEVIGNTSRRNYIEKSIKLGECIVAKEEGVIVGFFIYNTNFFECSLYR